MTRPVIWLVSSGSPAVARSQRLAEHHRVDKHPRRVLRSRLGRQRVLTLLGSDRTRAGLEVGRASGETALKPHQADWPRSTSGRRSGSTHEGARPADFYCARDQKGRTVPALYGGRLVARHVRERGSGQARGPRPDVPGRAEDRRGAPASHAVRHDHLDGRPGAARACAGDGPQPRPHLAGAGETASRWMRDHLSAGRGFAGGGVQLLDARLGGKQLWRFFPMEAVLRATRLHHARRRGRAATHATHSAARWARSTE